MISHKRAKRWWGRRALALTGLMIATQAFPGRTSVHLAPASAQESDVGPDVSGVPERVEGRSYRPNPQREAPPELRARIEALQAQRDATDAATPPEKVALPEVPPVPVHADRLPGMDEGDPNPDRINAPSRFDALTLP